MTKEELINQREEYHRRAVKAELKEFFRLRDFYKTEYHKIDARIKKLENK